MTHTMDLGVSEAYRHEAETEVKAADSATQELIVVRCECGEVWESPSLIGTFEEFEDFDGPVPYLEDWERHVWAEIKRAGQLAEAQANSVESSEDDGHNPPPYSDEPSSVSITIRPAAATGETEETDLCPACGYSKFASEDRCWTCRGEALSFEEERAKVAEHYVDVVARSLATLRQSLESELAPGESRSAMLRWFAQNIQDQGDMMARRLDELGGREL